MAPLIFVLAVDLLQSYIHEAYREGLIQLPFPCNGQMDYPIVQYADDMILLMPACPQHNLTIKDILNKYAQSIGLTINFHKSTLIPINLEPALASQMASTFGCTIGTMLFTYLGLPLGTSRPTIQDFMPLVSSVERSLSSTLSLMSHAGKLALLNSTVTSLLIDAMSTLHLPPKLIDLLDKIRRRCLWIKETEQGDKCNSLATWDMVCKHKNKGGPGVLNLRVQNEALLLKFLHKFYNKMDIPWVRLTWDSYYSQKIPHACDPVGSFWWKDIFKLTPIFHGISKVNIVCGTTALFWKDLWSDQLLQDSHPRAFSHSLNEDISVNDFLGIMLLEETFHLPLSPQAHAEVRDMQIITAEIQPSTTATDVWHYVWAKTIFKSTDYCRFFFRDIQPHQVFC